MKTNKKNSSLYYELFMKDNKKNYMLAFCAKIIEAVANILIAIMFCFLVDGIADKSLDIFFKGIIIGVLMILLTLIAKFMERKFANQYIMTSLSRYKIYIFKTILKKDISAYADISSSGFINSFSNDLQLIETNYIKGLIDIFFYIFQLVITLIVMAFLNIYLMLAIVVINIIPVFIALKTGNDLIKKEKKTSEKNETFIDQTKELLNGFVVIKSFKSEEQILKMFDNKNFVLENTKNERREADDSMQIIGTLSTGLMLVVIIILGIFFSFKGIGTLGSLFSFVQLTNYISVPIEKLFPMVTKYKASQGLIDKVIERLNNATVKEGNKTIDSFNKSICLNDLSFSYDGSEDAVKELDVEFKKGGSYAVVGLSGSGKTTLFKLMQGFYNDYRGSLTIDGIEMKEISSDSLATMLGIIQQNVFLFNASLQDNITMFGDFSREKLDDVVNKAGLSKLVNDKGYDYLCGDNGSNLSGGEQQRVSIARALLKDSSVLLMDEAMSALDNATAQEISDAVLAIPDITKILITHKLDERQLRKVDSIIVMNNGQIIEQGSFDELVNEKGMFWSLYNVSGMSNSNEEVLV